jgi:hypothetical protein
MKQMEVERFVVQMTKLLLFWMNESRLPPLAPIMTAYLSDAGAPTAETRPPIDELGVITLCGWVEVRHLHPLLSSSSLWVIL